MEGMFDITDIVLLTELNIDDLVSLEEKCFSTPWTKQMFLGDLKSEHTCYFGAFNDKDDLIGYIGMWCMGDTGEITNVAVNPEYRKIGIASMLLEKLVEYGCNKGLEFLNLEVRESNIPAINLYEKFDFKRVGLRKNYYKNPMENALLMTKTFSEERND